VVSVDEMGQWGEKKGVEEEEKEGRKEEKRTISGERKKSGARGG
jgi:hypothetical protein